MVDIVIIALIKTKTMTAPPQQSGFGGDDYIFSTRLLVAAVRYQNA